MNDTYLKVRDTIPHTKPDYLFADLAKICQFFAFGGLDWNNATKRNAEVIALTQEMEECIRAVSALEILVFLHSTAYFAF